MKLHTITKKWVQTLALLLVVVGGSVAPAAGVAIPGIQQSVAHAAIVASGNYGCAWDLDDAGTLTIHAGTLTNGNATMPWNTTYKDQVLKIVIEPNVFAGTGASYLFYNLPNLTEVVGGRNLDVSNSTNMQDMFANDFKLKSVDVSNWDTSNVNNMLLMFSGCNDLQTLKVDNWNTAKVSNMAQMFQNCTNLKNINVANWQTGVTSGNSVNCTAMFYGCSSLTQLDLTSWNMSGNTSPDMFSGASKLWKITLGPNFKLTTVPGLNTPVPGTEFDNVYKVTSDKWQEVGTGTVHNPAGAKLAVAEIPGNHNTTNTAQTYVWQGSPGTTVAEYNVEPSYTIIIPTGITIDNATNKGTDDVILGAHPKLPYAQSLITISVTSTTDWQLKNNHDTTGVDYLLGTSEGGSQLSSNGTFSFTADGENADDEVQSIYATLPAGSEAGFKYAETYSDTVNYTITTGMPPFDQ
ncbi:MAG: DUF285 domain-containing protein [Lactobacillaceae bacterium]|jgi:surface protein|nr:DUF285 domain-containing protein [Lactobacillaceae bacterium]